MKALVIWQDGHPSIEEVDAPTTGQYEALVQVTAGALCGTDMKILHDNIKGYKDYPTILGHEGVGRVVRVGDKVRNFKVGDKIVLPFNGRLGPYYSTWGAFAQYAVIGDAKAMEEDGHVEGDGVLDEGNFGQKVIPADFDDVEATMIVTFREVLSTIRRLGFHAGQSVVLYGAGPVGLVFVRLLKHLGLGPVVCVGRGMAKLKRAWELGADYIFSTVDTDVPARVRELFPKGPDVIIDAAGVPDLINQNLKLISDYGTICVYGVTPVNEACISWEEAPYSFNLCFAQWPSKREEAAVHDEVVDLMRRGVLNGMDYISDVFHFRDAVEAVDFFAARRNRSKVAICFDEPEPDERA